MVNVIAVPVLITYQGMEIHHAVATSWLIVAIVSVSATARHFLLGQRVPAGVTLLFAIGGTVGFEIALRMAHRLSGVHLSRLFAAAMCTMSTVMLARFLTM